MNDEKQIKTALGRLKNGSLVGLPTETVYGLAAPIDRPELVEKIFVLKERPLFDPLIVHVTGREQAKELTAEWPQVAELLVQKFWPGPLTVVLKKNDKISDLITAGLDTVGLRAPRHPVAQDFLVQANVPFAAPSANKFKKTSPTQASHVSASFDHEDVFVLEGGSSEVGIESSIVKIEEEKVILLRPGIISFSEIKEAIQGLKVSFEVFEGDSIVAPGQMKEHYRPEKPLLSVFSADEAAANYLFSTRENLFRISLPDEPALAARILYVKLREVAKTDAKGCALWVNSAYVNDDRWAGVLDRIKKASSETLFL